MQNRKKMKKGIFETWIRIDNQLVKIKREIGYHTQFKIDKTGIKIEKKSKSGSSKLESESKSSHN